MQGDSRPATAAEQAVLGKWTSWGALPKVFDAAVDEFGPLREQLRAVLDEREWSAARRTVLNAHYTSPAYAGAMWEALEGLGFESGLVLEPGCGAGVFMGLAPGGAHMTGVELDPVTAGIAGALYPEASVRTESFADSGFADGTFDAVIGNVPFANVRLVDRTHNPGRTLSMHNHFITKSLALTRPGGMVAVLTSRYTLDAKDTSAREQMARRADLVAAVRLPSGAHRAVAGTEAVTDLLVFRVRPTDQQADLDAAWVGVRDVQVPRTDGTGDATMTVNNVFADRPELVLGQLQVGHGMFAESLVVAPRAGLGDVGAQLSQVLAAQVAQAQSAGLVFTADARQDVPVIPDVQPVARVGDISGFEGHISRDDAGKWRQLSGGDRVELVVPAAQERQLAELVGLRDLATALLSAEAADSADGDALAGQRSGLNDAYEAYVDRFGPINKINISVSVKGVTSRRWPSAMRTFSADPHAPVVMALEDYDEASGLAKKMPIMAGRVVHAKVAVTTADTPQDAVAMVLDQTGEVSLDDVAAMLGVEEPVARDMIGELVFDDPETDGRLIPAAEYLSGNVRQALAVAVDAAQTMPQFAVNVSALAEVLPVDRQPSQITPRLGSVWIPDTDVQAFLRETLKDRRIRVLNLGGSQWEVQGDKHTQAATSTWGTQRMDALTIAHRSMQQQRIAVEDTVENADGKEQRVANEVESDAARDKARLLQERFAQWVWEDPDRTTRLVADYNRRFNSVVLRSYDQDGQRLSLPGLASWFTPHAHQRSAVARMRAESSVGLFHEVGAGKTAEMIMGTSELKRLGMVTKPLITVPNNVLEQFTRDWMAYYPQAMVLAATSDQVNSKNRAKFIARAATGDWDAIIMTHSAFSRIGVSDETKAKYTERTLAELRASLERADGDPDFTRTVKRIEAKIVRTEEALKEKVSGVSGDAGMTWEQMGVDYLVVDELHLFKNLGVASRMQGVTAEGGPVTMDFDMKVAQLREKAGPGGRVITGATATPIANAVCEAYVMQHYLRPDLLEDAGLTDFDAWAATFAQEVTKPELRPVGGFGLKTRLARYQNIPDLLRMFHTFADVQTAEDLNLPGVPQLRVRSDGQRLPETVMVPASMALLDYMDELDERADMLSAGSPWTRYSGKQDIAATVSGDGRLAGLDMHMVTPMDVDQLLPLSDEDTMKLDVVAQRIHGIWEDTRDASYPVKADAEEMHPAPGGLQIVFMDLGTPGGVTWNTYEALRDKLEAAGMDPARVVFSHDAKSDADKARMFEQCRTGAVDVIIGSTARMGVGTNIQLRAVALHHVDCPWRPDELHQREGRIVRQGNANSEVQILRYATESSFDAYLWQTVERKATFINQFMNGSLDADEVDEIESAEMTNMAAIKAVTSGNPLLLEHAEVQADVATLRRLETAHGRDQSHRHHQVVQKTNLIERYTTDVIPRLEAAVAARTDTTGKAFAATIEGRTVADRRDAADQVRATLNHGVVGLNQYSRPVLQMRDVARLGGHVIDATGHAGRLGQEATVDLVVRSAPERATVVTAATLREEGIGVITRMENLVGGLDQTLAAAQTTVQTARAERSEAQSKLGEPFPKTAELNQGQQRLESLQSRLEAQPPRVRERRTRRTSTGHAALRPAALLDLPTGGDSTGITASDTTDAVQRALQSRIDTSGLRKVREALEHRKNKPAPAPARDERRDPPQQDGPTRGGPTQS